MEVTKWLKPSISVSQIGGSQGFCCPDDAGEVRPPYWNDFRDAEAVAEAVQRPTLRRPGTSGKSRTLSNRIRYRCSFIR